MAQWWLIVLAGCAGMDADRDGFAAPEDCNDADASAYPGAAEACDGIDNNCNGDIDEGVTRALFADTDGDGFGDPLATVPGCDPTEGVVDNALDCDDTDPDNRPGADEVCDEFDNDCDGAIDEGVTTIVYVDQDEDGHGDPAFPTPACAVVPGLAAAGDDCDDADAAIRPGVDERCDGIDNDCDLRVDEDPVDAPPRFVDVDADGYGDVSVVSCDPVPGTVSLGGDCNDADATINPGLVFDPCDNGVDDDCDGLIDNDCPVEHCGFIGVDETWAAGPVHRVSCEIIVSGSNTPTLTIEDGALVVFDPDTYLRSGNPGFRGQLVLDGHTQGITLMSSSPQPAPGDWQGVVFSSTDVDSVFNGVTVAHAGGGEATASVVVGNTDVQIRDCVIRDGATDGIRVGTFGTVAVSGTELSGHAGSGLVIAGGELATGGGPTFTNNVVTGNGTSPVDIRVPDIAELDPSSTFVGNADDRVVVRTGGVTTDSIWQAIDVPLYFTETFSVGAGQTPELVLSDGLVLQFAWNTGLNVGSSNGSLVVDGHTNGVVMESEFGSAGAPGDWRGLEFFLNSRPSRIDGLILRHGGGNGVAGLTMTGVDLTMTDSEIVENANHGIWLNGGSTLGLRDSTVQDNTGDGVHAEGELSAIDRPSFTDNVLTGNGGLPLVIPANSMTEVDGTNALAGNGNDQVGLASDVVNRGGTWTNVGLPLWVQGQIEIRGVNGPVITIESGHELRFEPESSLVAGFIDDGGLIADGATAPIVFTSAQANPAPGDWRGLLYYSNCLEPSSRLENVEVRYAGSDLQGAVQFLGCDGSVTDSIIEESASYGIYRQGASPVLTNVMYAGNVAGDLF